MSRLSWRKKSPERRRQFLALVASANHLLICVDKQQGAATWWTKIFGGFWVMRWCVSCGRSTRRSFADWSQPASATSVQTSRRRQRNKWSRQQDSWWEHLIKVSVQSVEKRNGTSGCYKMKKQTAVIPDENICRNLMEVYLSKAEQRWAELSLLARLPKLQPKNVWIRLLVFCFFFVFLLLQTSV